MRLASTVLLPLALVLTNTPCLSAQESVQVESGARARLISVALPTDQQVVSIISATSDSIVFRPERTSVTRRLALSEIAAIDISIGQRRKTVQGALIGLATGVGIGATLGYVTYEACNDWCFLTPASAGGNAMLGATAGGLAGLLAGTTIGFLTKSETWHRIQPRGRVSLSPMRGGGLLSVAF